MLGKMIAGGSAADGAPQYSGNFGAPANYWQGNQMMIPGAPPNSPGMGGAMQPQTQPQNPQGLLQMLMQDPQAMAALMKQMGMQ